MHLARIAAACLALCVLATPAMAQEGRGNRRGGPEMTPEQIEAVWQLQARSVSKQYGVSDDAVSHVVTIYVDSRQGMQKALQDMRGQRGEGQRGEGQRGDRGQRGQRGQRGGRMNEAMMALRDEYRGGMTTELGKYVQGDTLQKIIKPLGSFDGQWDRMVHTLVGFKLPDDKMQKAMTTVTKYVVARSGMQFNRGGGGDFEAMRERFMAAREDLVYGLENVLSADQMDAFQQSLQRGRRGGNFGGGRGARGDRGDRGTGGQRRQPMTDRDREERLQKALAELELPDDQRKQVDTIVAEHKASLQKLFESALSGSMTREEMAEKRKTLTSGLTTKIKDIIGQDQYDKLIEAAGLDRQGGRRQGRDGA